MVSKVLQNWSAKNLDGNSGISHLVSLARVYLWSVYGLTSPSHAMLSLWTWAQMRAGKRVKMRGGKKGKREGETGGGRENWLEKSCLQMGRLAGLREWARAVKHLENSRKHLTTAEAQESRNSSMKPRQRWNQERRLHQDAMGVQILLQRRRSVLKVQASPSSNPLIFSLFPWTRSQSTRNPGIQSLHGMGVGGRQPP